jgi:hypothetical protein
MHLVSKNEYPSFPGLGISCSHFTSASWLYASQSVAVLFKMSASYALVVKSVSVGSSPPSAAFSHVHELAERIPQEQVSPAGLVFSVAAREQVHSPAARAPGGG